MVCLCVVISILAIVGSIKGILTAFLGCGKPDPNFVRMTRYMEKGF